nr:MAG TPA: hypothetical protein [Caudoviricetes sp.]
MTRLLIDLLILGDGIKYYSKKRELNCISKKEITEIFYILK